MADNIEDEIIELTQLAEDNVSNGEEQGVIELLDISTLPDEVNPKEVRAEEVHPGRISLDEPILDEPILGAAITQEQVDAALERVIEKKFAGKIEKILFEVMEKVIGKEITDIRERLQKDLDDLGSN